jgi:hypothetical protein
LQSSVADLLHSLRQQALAQGAERLGSHQLNAHWSLAYACSQAPEAWEIYRVPFLHPMPATDFFTKHAREIQDVLKPQATWDFLHLHAVEKLALEAGMTERERRAHGYPGKVQYYDFTFRKWATVDVPSVRWFDGREIAREAVARTRDEFRAGVFERLSRLKQKTADNPTPKRVAELASYEKYVAGQFLVNLERFDTEKRAVSVWLDRLDTTRDLGKAIFALLREAENEVRAARGIAAIGEAWVSETELLYRVRKLLPGIEVIAHGQPEWLGRQHLDIWIPAQGIGIEYHGVQHFQAIEFFGGKEAFQRGQERDKRKRALCEKHGLNLSR